MATPQRILFVESGRGYGGSVFSLRRLVKSVDRSRFEPRVIAFHRSEPFEGIKALGVPVTVFHFFRPFFEPTVHERNALDRVRNYVSEYGNLAADTVCTGLRIARYIRRERIALVHLNNGILENLSAAFAARLTRRPCVSHVRGTEQLTKVEKHCARWMSAIITLNRTVHADYAGLVGTEKLHLIHNGVDLDALQHPERSRLREELQLGPESFAVGTFARLVEGKGIPEFISAAARVATTCSHVRFFVVGDDPSADKVLESDLRRRAADVGLGSRLLFTGWRNDRIDVMAAMDLVVQVSSTFPEGMSLAPLEAMALSKPVIVTAIPGYEFCVEDGTTGFVIPPGDADALAARMLRLVQDPARGVEMGRAARQKAVREFDVRLTARRIETVYDQLLPQSRNGAEATASVGF